MPERVRHDGENLRRGLLHRGADAIHHRLRLHLRRIVAFGHDADDGFGARGADDEAAGAVQFGLGGGDRILHAGVVERLATLEARSEEHTSELQSLMRISYAVFCLKKTTMLNPKT